MKKRGTMVSQELIFYSRYLNIWIDDGQGSGDRIWLNDWMTEWLADPKHTIFYAQSGLCSQHPHPHTLQSKQHKQSNTSNTHTHSHAKYKKDTTQTRGVWTLLVGEEQQGEKENKKESITHIPMSTHTQHTAYRHSTPALNSRWCLIAFLSHSCFFLTLTIDDRHRYRPIKSSPRRRRNERKRKRESKAYSFDICERRKQRKGRRKKELFMPLLHNRTRSKRTKKNGEHPKNTHEWEKRG